MALLLIQVILLITLTFHLKPKRNLHLPMTTLPTQVAAEQCM